MSKSPGVLRFLSWWVYLRLIVVVGVGAASLLLIYLTTRVKIADYHYPAPQAILVLDGDNQRMQQAVLFAKQQSALPVWISGNCSHRPDAQAMFSTVPQNPQHLHYDLRATDTVTNFTTLVDDFVNQEIRHVYLVTSDYHMQRSLAIATIVFGSRGIAVTPISQTSDKTIRESWSKLARDGGRAFLWLITGYSGAHFNPHTHHLPGGVSCRFQFK